MDEQPSWTVRPSQHEWTEPTVQFHPSNEQRAELKRRLGYVPEWAVKSSQHEWTDGQTWHAHTAVVVSPDGRECSLEEVCEVLNQQARQLALLVDMPALISG